MRRSVLAVFLLLSSIVIAAAGRRRAVGHPPPPAPVANADSYSADQGGTLTIAAPGVLANDTLHGGAVLKGFGASTGSEQAALGTSAQTAQGGSVSLTAAGGFTYTPSSAFSGTDTFRYVVGNAGGSSSATVTISVQVAGANAVSDAYTTEPGTPLVVPAPGVLFNDTLAGGTIVSFGARSGTEQTSFNGVSPTVGGGVISLRQDGGFHYNTPPTVDDGYGYSRPYLGPDSFAYMIKSGSVTSMAVVHISVEEQADEDADFTVTTPGHYYAVSGQSGENPVLTLKRGRTYTFQLRADAIHPFAIEAPAGTVTNNNVTHGLVTFAVPAVAQSYRYRCTTHGFGNVIETVP